MRIIKNVNPDIKAGDKVRLKINAELTVEGHIIIPAEKSEFTVSKTNITDQVTVTSGGRILLQDLEIKLYGGTLLGYVPSGSVIKVEEIKPKLIGWKFKNHAINVSIAFSKGIQEYKIYTNGCHFGDSAPLKKELEEKNLLHKLCIAIYENDTPSNEESLMETFEKWYNDLLKQIKP